MKEVFSKQAPDYARSRPHYPVHLISFLASLCQQKKLAWDCATGNGQAAFALADEFETVIATDNSNDQLMHAFKHPNITYREESYEKTLFENDTVDLITVATAVHWFDLEKFYAEANRVLKKDGILAVWTYADSEITPEIDKIVKGLSSIILKDYWPPQTKLSWNGYKDLAFPYPLISVPQFNAVGCYNCDEFLSFMNSWSSVRSYKEKNFISPVNYISNELKKAWGEKKRTVKWQLYLKCGRKEL